MNNAPWGGSSILPPLFNGLNQFSFWRNGTVPIVEVWHGNGSTLNRGAISALPVSVFVTALTSPPLSDILSGTMFPACNVDLIQFIIKMAAVTGLLYLVRWFCWRINAWCEVVAMTSKPQA
jgi:hypothetical protein